MFIGHAAPAFIAKLFLPHTSLGGLLMACGLPDLLTFTLAIFGIETFRFNKTKQGALPCMYTSCTIMQTTAPELTW